MVVQAGFTRKDISIHVPRMGDDFIDNLDLISPENFYPRPPYGGRLAPMYWAKVKETISIHVPRMGDDR